VSACRWCRSVGRCARWCGRHRRRTSRPVAQFIAAQFDTPAAAAEGCNALVATGSTHFAAWSVTDKLDIPYVYATFCPINLPSPHHPLPQGGGPAINTHRVAIEAMVNA
jgi:hypothetical protein